MEEFTNYNVMLIGLGPHAKRIYINLFKKYKITPKLIVDLKSKELEIKQYLEINNLKNVNLYLLTDEEKDNIKLSKNHEKKLKSVIKNKNIKYAIISTEPKAHFAYAKFLLENNINILMDKPITAPKNVNNKIFQTYKIKKEYDILCDLYRTKKDKINFKIQCQRRFHTGYLFVKKLLSEVVSEYNIPITYIDIYHNDGMWNMPNEFIERENHPYKYGYGKLFHSGYHFIDLLSWLLEVNNRTIGKKIDNAQMYVSTNNPIDFFNVFNNYDYKQILKTNKFEKYLSEDSLFKNFGEIDFHANIDFKQKDNLITNCSLNLMQSGFSRRAWHELPTDTYKSNGRVRHERLNIHVGPLMNIQVHSYQAYEIADKDKVPVNSIGGIEHFDIHVFRNSKLIGGKTLETFNFDSLSNENEICFIGHNEQARENCFINFLLDIDDSSDLLQHRVSIELLEKAYEAMVRKEHCVKFKLNI